MYNIVQKRRWYYTFSTLIIVASVVAMVYSTIEYGTPVLLGVDFESGSRFVLRLEGAASEDAVRNVFEQFGFNNPNVTRLGDPSDNTWQIRTKFVDADTAEAIVAQLSADVAPVDKAASSVDSVSPAISKEVTRSAAIAISAGAAYFMIVEPLVGTFWDSLGEWGPSAVFSALAEGGTAAISYAAAVILAAGYGLISLAISSTVLSTS